MTVSQELREWAIHDRDADVNNISYPAWVEMTSWRLGYWIGCFVSDDQTRTFALLVACALEDE